MDHQNHAEVVRDRQHPGNTDWKVVNAWPYWRIPVDYAIISRVLDATTEQMVVVVAGITHYGTQAAGEFVTNPVYFAEVVKRAPRDWSRKNMQIVLSAKVMTETVGRRRWWRPTFGRSSRGNATVQYRSTPAVAPESAIACKPSR